MQTISNVAKIWEEADMRATKCTYSPWPSFASLSGAILLGAFIYVAPAHGTIPSELSDQSISDAVEDEIQGDLLVPLNRIDVLTTDGIVTLSGLVGNLVAKERAERIAESVKGVRAVINEIVVRYYPTRSPVEMERNIEDALFANPATESYEVDVQAEEDGTVILSGTVQSWVEKDLAEQVTKTVAGVTEVRNDINVNEITNRTDVAIKAEVEERLRWNVLVDDGLIDVSVEDGEVLLKGTVGSAAEKRKARRNAWVPGVQAVNASGLKVERWTRDDDLRNPLNAEVRDKEIEAALEKALFYDPRVNSAEIEVNSSYGVVALRGEVGSLQARQAAERDAQNTVGVLSVTNRLKVRPEVLIGDTALAREVENALARDAVTESWEIDVSATDGVVTLTGIVDNYYEKSRADIVAGSINGVEGVKNLLTVVDLRSPYTVDPYYEPWAPLSRDWYDYQAPTVTMRSDTEIKESIESELWWSPFVDSDEVTVTVNNGVATLTGTVDSWSERLTARENALEGGAIWVVNDLLVNPSES